MDLLKIKFDALKAHADLSYTLGIYFGYPNCCITNFCNDLLNEKDCSHRNIDGSGFVPCEKHYNEIKNKKTTLKDLVKNRICDVEFNKK